LLLASYLNLRFRSAGIKKINEFEYLVSHSGDQWMVTRPMNPSFICKIKNNKTSKARQCKARIVYFFYTNIEQLYFLHYWEISLEDCIWTSQSEYMSTTT
jgi:hypothetical protein